MRNVMRVLVVSAPGLLAACAAPFADYQSARLVAPGTVELTPSYSYVQASAEGEREKVQDEIGLQVAGRLSDRAELRGRYTLVSIDGDLVNTLGVGPKFGLARDRLALYTPIGFGFGSGVDVAQSFQLQPTLLLTLIAARSFELTGSGKALVWLNNEADDTFAFNLGVGLGPDVSRWAIRPEAGVMINPGEDGSIWHYGVAFSTAMGGDR